MFKCTTFNQALVPSVTLISMPINKYMLNVSKTLAGYFGFCSSVSLIKITAEYLRYSFLAQLTVYIKIQADT